MVYDVNKRSSFESCVEYWLPEIRDVVSDQVTILLVGNQIDRCSTNEDLREVTTEEAEAFALQNDLLFIETSAVLNSNVQDAF